MAKTDYADPTKLINGDKYCIHITNLSVMATAQELSTMFQTHEEYVLFDTKKNEAWIKNIYQKDTAVMLADKYNGKLHYDGPMQCQAMLEFFQIAKLCRHNRHGKCKFGHGCSMKHVACKNPDKCSDTTCYYGHSANHSAVYVPPLDYQGNVDFL